MGFFRKSLVQAILMLAVAAFAIYYIWDNSQKHVKKNNFHQDKAESNFEKIHISGESGTFQILLIPIHGIICRGESDGLLSSSIADADTIIEMLEDAAGDPQIKAVVLDLNTPGGEVVATDLIYQKILALRKKNIPVVASMSVMAASGGYYLAAGASKIVAHPLTTTGSIGVIIHSLKYHELESKIGVRSENYTSGQFKDILSGSRPTSPEERELIKNHLNQVYMHFAKVVSEGRKIPLAKVTVSPIGDGRIMLGSEALQLGLVDQLGDLDTAETTARKLASLHDDCEVVTYRQRISFLKMASKFFQAQGEHNGKLKIELPMNTLPKASLGRFYFLMEQ